MDNLQVMSTIKTMDSREIAELTNKEHYNVLRDIDNMFAQLGDVLKNEDIYIDSMNRKQRYFKLNQEEIMTLITGYSIPLRMAVIKRWKQLEEEVKEKPMTFEEVMQNALMLADQKVKQLENKIELDKPKVNYAEAVSGSETSIKIEEFVKSISSEYKIGRNKCFAWLRENKYLTSKNLPYQNYINLGIFECKESLVSTPFGSKRFLTTLVTGKGGIYLLDKLKTL